MVNEKLLKLADFIEKYPDFDQHDEENCVVGVGNRLNDTFTELLPHQTYESDYFGTANFATRFEISSSYADAFYRGELQALGVFDEKDIKKLPERDSNNQSTINKKTITTALRKLAKKTRATGTV